MVDTPLAEATMIYRKPVKGSDPLAVQDVWGQQLETRTVDASEVEALRGDGWVAHPSHIDGPPEPEKANEAWNDAEREHLLGRIATLEADLKAATELADAESKAKEAALAQLAAATTAETGAKSPDPVLQSAKPTLGIKAK